MFLYAYLCKSECRDQVTRKEPTMGAGKALREKASQHKTTCARRTGKLVCQEQISVQVGGRWKEGGAQGGGRDKGLAKRRGPAPSPQNIEGHQRNQQQSTPVPKWCCQELVNTKSAGCAASGLGPDSFHRVTDGIRMWLLLTTESV